MDIWSHILGGGELKQEISDVIIIISTPPHLLGLGLGLTDPSLATPLPWKICNVKHDKFVVFESFTTYNINKF